MASLQKTTTKGINYYSIVECRRINGKPTPVTIAYLGNVEKILDMFNNQSGKTASSDVNFKSFSYGAVFALWKIAQKHNIIKYLNSFFPKQTRSGLSRGETILLASIYRAIYPGSKNEFSEKMAETSLASIAKFNPDKTTSHHFWSQMDGIEEKMLHDAEDAIAERILGYYEISPEKLALDYTNYFTYIDSNNEKSELAKRGHNKQKRNDLRQFSLGSVTTKELAIPLCSYIYEGNVSDVTAFPKYLDLFRKRIGHYTDATDITLIYDNGSVSKDNLAELKNQKPHYHYVCAFSLSCCKDLLDIPVDDYQTVSICGDKDILCYRTTRDIWGEKRDCILIYSEDLYKGQYKGLLTSIGKKEQELLKLKEQLKNPKSRICKAASAIDARIKKIIKGDFGESIFEINKTGIRIIKDIDFSVNYDAVKEICYKHYGKRLIITDRFAWSTEETLEAYWGQSDIENIFKDSKNRDHFSVQPQFHWTDSKVKVHTFCCLLGLTLTSLLKKELADSNVKISNKKLIDVLSGIREVYILTPDKKAKNGFSVEKRLEQMSQIQQTVWSVLEKKVFCNKG